MSANSNDRSYVKRALLGGQRLDLIPWRVRRAMLRAAGLQIAESAFFESNIEFVPGKMNVGEHAYVNRGCLFDTRGGIEIGGTTLIGPRVSFLTATHKLMDSSRPRGGPTEFMPIQVGSGVWIGAGALILPGSIIGDGCVVAAGSVVRGELKPDAMYAGVPATERKAYMQSDPERGERDGG